MPSSSAAMLPASVVRRTINTLGARHWLMVIDRWRFGTRQTDAQTVDK